MRLLLDEMYWPAIAEQLVDRGHDVSAAVTRPALSSIADEQLFAAAQDQRRAIVTENVGDYIPIAQHYGVTGTPHHGLVPGAGRTRAYGSCSQVTKLSRLLARYLLE